ncbi:MAG: hypothetical protein ACPGQS_06625 [Bradymonadia bacterium]
MFRLLSNTLLLGLMFALGCASGEEIDTDVSPDQNANATSTSTGPTQPTNTTQPTNANGTQCLQNLSSESVRHMRVKKLEIPTTAAEAAALNCEISIGTNRGSGLSGLVSMLEFDLEALVSPDANGVIPSVLIASLDGWGANMTDQDVGALAFRIFGEAGQSIHAPFSITDRATPVYDVPASVNCEELSTGVGTFNLEVPLLNGQDSTPLALEHAHLSGTLQTGTLEISRGTLNGYLTRASLRGIIVGLQDACRQGNAPELCGADSPILTADVDDMVDFAATFLMGGFDSTLTPQGLEACTGSNCNAVSVCIAFETESVSM